MVANSPTPAPRHKLRFSARCLALVLAVVMAVSSVAPVHAQYYGGGSGYEYYSGGNMTFGDFGGFGFSRGDYGGRLIEGSIGGGAGVDLGCGAINIMDYMKATFNVNNLVERAKASMQTMVAKYVMVFLLSQPIIASAMDKLNGMLNFGYDMFNQSCDLSEIQKLAKARYTRDCIAEGNHPADCQEMSDPLKGIMGSSVAEFSEDMKRVLSDPVGSLQGSMGCSSSGVGRNGAAQSDTCLLLAFAPRPCGNMDFGGGSYSGNKGGFGGNLMDGCRSSEAPFSMNGVFSYSMEGGARATHKFARSIDDIRRANPRSTVADMDIISERTVARLNETSNANRNVASARQSGQPTQLAMTNVSYLTKAFGNGESEASKKMLDEYRQSDLGLNGCSEESRTNPLLIPTTFVQVANEHFSKSGGGAVAQPVFSEAEKLKIEDYFDFNKIPPELQQKMGIDAKSAAIMLEETTSCLMNGRAGMDQIKSPLNPLAAARISTGRPVLFGGQLQTVPWDVMARGAGAQVGCHAVNKVFSFMLLKFKNTKSNLELDPTITLPGTTVTNSDGTTVTKDQKSMDAAEAKAPLNAALDGLINDLQAKLDASNRSCQKLSSSGLSV